MTTIRGFIERFEIEVLRPYGMKFRPKQREAVYYAIKAIESGFRNVLMELPTGIGKSLANFAIAKYFNEKYGWRAFYTTPQVVLLEQIEKDPVLDIAVVKGRANYHCVIDRGKTAANARCITGKFRCFEECPYKLAKRRALMYWISAMSFAYLIYDRFVPEEFSFGNRELIIVDEADDLEGWAEEFGSFKFKTDNEFKDIDDVIIWAKAVLKNVNRKIAELESEYELTDAQVKELEKLKKYRIKLTVFLTKVRENPRNWVFEKQKEYLIVKPVNVGQILQELVWSRGRYRICSSATIISKDMFCKYCGLKEHETFMIKASSIFPKENRPVYYVPIAKMTKEERVNGYDKIVDAIVKIAEKHRGEKGLICAHSYEIAKEIYKRLSVDRTVIAHDEKNRMKMFKRFVEAKDDAIFIAVGFERGIDLKYDMCRWMCICKVPFPDQSDIRVRELWVNRKAWNWVRWNAIKTLIQACGRLVRAPDDYGVVYILDESFGYLVRYKKQFPEWFLESVIFCESLEEVLEDGGACGYKRGDN